MKVKLTLTQICYFFIYYLAIMGILVACYLSSTFKYLFLSYFVFFLIISFIQFIIFLMINVRSKRNKLKLLKNILLIKQLTFSISQITIFLIQIQYKGLISYFLFSLLFGIILIIAESYYYNYFFKVLYLEM